MDQRRTTGFLLGLVLVLAIFYVAMEWNSSTGSDSLNPIDLGELVHESELVPMSNVETVSELHEKKQVEKAEQLNIVEDHVDLEQAEEELEGEKEGETSECPLPSFAVAAEPCGHDEKEYIECGGAYQ